MVLDVAREKNVAHTNQLDYERLCRLDLLGLEDAPEHDQRVVYNMISKNNSLEARKAGVKRNYHGEGISKHYQQMSEGIGVESRECLWWNGLERLDDPEK